jgi:uncharacterized protein YkwD
LTSLSMALNACQCKDYVKAHNAKRVAFGLTAMVHDARLEENALKHANSLRSQGCIAAKTPESLRSAMQFGPSGAFTGVGENMAVHMRTDLDWEAVVLSWWEEIASYNYGADGSACTKTSAASEVAHFSQVFFFHQ